MNAQTETHEIEHNDDTGSTMHMFVRHGTVTLSEENTSETGRNREDAWIRCDDGLLAAVEQ